MNHLDLFSGIGGFALAAKWTWGNDYVNLGHSEIEKFPCKVYHRHFPESKCLGDITKIDWSQFERRLIAYPDNGGQSRNLRENGKSQSAD